jgi:hypothetical protein
MIKHILWREVELVTFSMLIFQRLERHRIYLLCGVHIRFQVAKSKWGSILKSKQLRQHL